MKPRSSLSGQGGFSISLEVHQDNNNAFYFIVKRLKSVKLTRRTRVLLSLRRKIVTRQISDILKISAQQTIPWCRHRFYIKQ